MKKKYKISKAKYNICFWPIMVCVSDRRKATEARRWNHEHAQIEVKSIKNMTEVAAHFAGLAEAQEECITWDIQHFGGDSQAAKQGREIKAFYLSIAKVVME